LERELALFSSPRVGLVHCGAELLVDGAVTSVPVALPPPDAAPATVYASLARANFVCNSSVVVRRSALGRHGLLDADPELRGVEDYELWLRLAPHVGFGYVPDPLVLYRVRPDGVGSDPDRMLRG